MISSNRIQNTLDYCRTYPSLTAALGNPVAGSGGNNVAVRIANKVIQDILARPFAWKWNRKVAPYFVTNSLQQDYSTSILDVGWLENNTAVQINSTALPKPIRGVTAVRDLSLTSMVGLPDSVSWCYNSEAVTGSWLPNQKYVYQIPGDMVLQPLTQITDSNGNIQVLTTFGTTGSSAPAWKTVAGQTTSDGTCVWTMVDSNGITWRLSPCPAQSGTAFLIEPYYQIKAPVVTTVNMVWPLPDEISGVYEQGFLAYAWDAAEDEARFEKEFALFQGKIQQAVGAGDREAESYSIVPARGHGGRGGYITPGSTEGLIARFNP